MRTEGATNLNPELVEFVRAKALMFPSVPRETLATTLRYEIEAEERADWRVPSHDNLVKMISNARNHDSPLDKQWSLSCLSKKDYYIPSEAKPTVVAAYRKRLAEKEILTIREALWMGRLYGIVESKDSVYDWAFLYAISEMISEANGSPFNSKKLDLEMIKNPDYASETQKEIAIWKIAQKYGADPVKLKNLNLSIEESEEIARSGKYS